MSGIYPKYSVLSVSGSLQANTTDTTFQTTRSVLVNSAWRRLMAPWARVPFYLPLTPFRRRACRSRRAARAGARTRWSHRVMASSLTARGPSPVPVAGVPRCGLRFSRVGTVGNYVRAGFGLVGPYCHISGDRTRWSHHVMASSFTACGPSPVPVAGVPRCGLRFSRVGTVGNYVRAGFGLVGPYCHISGDSRISCCPFHADPLIG